MRKLLLRHRSQQTGRVLLVALRKDVTDMMNLTTTVTRERERQRQRQRDREMGEVESKKGTDRQTDRQTDKPTGRQRANEKEREKGRRGNVSKGYFYLMHNEDRRQYINY